MLLRAKANGNVINVSDDKGKVLLATGVFTQVEDAPAEPSSGFFVDDIPPGDDEDRRHVHPPRKRSPKRKSESEQCD